MKIAKIRRNQKKYLIIIKEDEKLIDCIEVDQIEILKNKKEGKNENNK